jgi:hypothetical protein
MEASQHTVFFYHADASPFGGHLTHPTERIIPAHASSSLPQAGGYASSRMGPIHHDEIVSCEAAYSTVSGAENTRKNGFTTLVTSVVEELNVLEIVKADRVVSRLTVEHPSEPTKANPNRYPKVSFVGSHFENLRIDGVPVNPVLKLDLLENLKNMEGVCKDKLKADKDLVSEKALTEEDFLIDEAIGQYKRMIDKECCPAWIKTRYASVDSEEDRRKKGFVPCSLVREFGQVNGTRPPNSFGHIIPVAGFGNVFLGEVLVAPHLFRLTMIRVELGCPVKGHLSFASANSNGYPAP